MPKEALDDTNEEEIIEDTAQDDSDALPEIEDAPSDDEEWSEEDMRLLSDEERAALFESDDDDDAAAEDDDPAAVEDPAVAAKADTAEDMTGTAGADVDALKADIAALDEEKTAAFDAWEDGDMTRDEYLSKLKEIDNQSRDLVSELAVAQDKEKQVVTTFLKTAGSYFREYPALASPDLWEGYDRHVRAVTGDARYQHMTHRQMLEAAHVLYASEAAVLGIEVPAPGAKKAAKPAPAPEAKPEAKAEEPRKRPGDKAPKTLAGLPSAQQVSVSDGKYSALAQRLEQAGPEEYERIMGSLSPAEAEAFASMDV